MLPVFAQVIPADIPEWVWLILAAAAGWFGKDFWPWYKAQRSAEAKARRDAAEARARAERDAAQHERQADEERYLRAFEQSSAAQLTTANALEKIGTALDMFARASVATTFELSELRREMRGRKGDTKTDRATLAKMLGEEPTP